MLDPVFLEAEALRQLSSIKHGFFTRKGGASEGLYASLNAGLGSGDRREIVEQNRAAIAGILGTKTLATPYQIHSAKVVRAEQIGETRPEADGIVCAEPARAIGIVTADCGPVLFADEEAGVVGACHAGWKGALFGVLEETINVMEQAGAKSSHITAALGPTIQAKAYEVSGEFPTPFLARDSEASRFFKPAQRAGHAMFDLAGYIVWRLQAAGVATAESTGHCTYSDEANFYSYRRATHRNEIDYGRQISAIAIQDK